MSKGSPMIRIGRAYIAAAQEFAQNATGKEFGPRQAVEFCLASTITEKALNDLEKTLGKIVLENTARAVVGAIQHLTDLDIEVTSEVCGDEAVLTIHNKTSRQPGQEMGKWIKYRGLKLAKGEAVPPLAEA